MIPSSNDWPISPKTARLLVLLLRLCGFIDCLAFLVTLMPVTWIGSLHAHLNIGPFPSDTITHYLARSSSLMYVFHGLLLIFVSFNIHRYFPLIRFLALLALFHGLLLLAIDLHTSMPWFWTALEGPLLFAWGALTWRLTSPLG